MFSDWYLAAVVIYGKMPSLVVMNTTLEDKLSLIEYALVLS